MIKNKGLRFAAGAAVLLFIMVAMVWIKTYAYGHGQFVDGEKAFKANDLKTAVTDYETAIHMYTPFGGYVDASAARLWEIGQGYENVGDYDWALIAYRSLRSSFYAVRSFYTPGQGWIERTEKQIDAVLEKQKAQNMNTKGQAAPAKTEAAAPASK
ncbi:MAG TPA: hypothetical protein VGK71_03675 [Nitrospirota bacterium]